MKTVLYSRNGSADAVLEFADKPIPEPRTGEVLVKLATSGVNPSDVKSRAGRAPAFDFVIPHSDGAGVIEAVGEGADTSRVGERVWIWNGQWQRQYGTAAEYIAVPEFQAVKLDDEITFETAACFGIPGLTAAHAVNLLASDNSETVLVTGAASAVGHYITQMTTLMGRKVIGTASAVKHDIVLEAGAIGCIDYKTENVADRTLELTSGEGVGAIIDMDFYSTSQLISAPALQAKGTIYSYGSNDMGAIDVPFRDLLFKSISLQFFLVYELDRAERMAAIDRLNWFMRSGHARTRISHTLPLDEIVQAHELVESGQAGGNVVLTI
ncbi:MAG: NADPH:quinone reductase [Rhizobiaceae bacterium]|nr:NADPH:quinone reductase [Rhizobiaceae bacterium]